MARWQVHRADGNEADVVQALIAVGASVEKIGRPLDLLVGFRGRTYVLEVKTARGKVRASQREFLARWQGHAAIVRSVSDALAAIGVSG